MTRNYLECKTSYSKVKTLLISSTKKNTNLITSLKSKFNSMLISLTRSKC